MKFCNGEVNSLLSLSGKSTDFQGYSLEKIKIYLLQLDLQIVRLLQKHLNRVFY